jgi:hypothetical protein
MLDEVNCLQQRFAIALLKLAYEKYLFVFRFLSDETKTRFRESEFDFYLLSKIEKLLNKQLDKSNE